MRRHCSLTVLSHSFPKISCGQRIIHEAWHRVNRWRSDDLLVAYVGVLGLRVVLVAVQGRDSCW